MKRVLVLAAAMLCLSGFAWADTVTINGGNYENYYGNPSNAAYVNNGNDVTVTAGGFEGNASVYNGVGYVSVPGTAFINSAGTLTVNGGSFDGATGIDNSATAIINNGDISQSGSNGYTGAIVNSGTITINGGHISGGYAFLNHGMAIINGGSVPYIESGGALTINGGSLPGYIANWGALSIKGGNFSGGLVRGSKNGFGATFIYGTFAQYGALPSLPWNLGGYYGSITGTLADGTTQTINYWNEGQMYLEPSPVPEPSSMLPLLCGVGAMGGIVWRRRLA